MFKKIVSPFQDVLLKRQLCVGCTHPLSKTKKLGNLTETKELVQCKCSRRYLKDKETREYKRASFEQEQEHLNKKKLIG